MGYPLRPKNLKKSGLNDDNVAALKNLQRKVNALTEGQPNTGGVGALTWDPLDGTYNVAGDDGVSLKVAGDTIYYAKNTSGVTMPKGSTAMFTGTVGASGNLTFGQAIADGSVISDFMMGVVLSDVPNNEFGYVKDFGLIRGFRTDGADQGETWSDGDLLYFSPSTPGQLTNILPVSPAIQVPIAVVLTASQGNNGSIFVRMSISQSLLKLRDVYVDGTLADGEVLIYDQAQQRFEANTLTAGNNVTIQNAAGAITINADVDPTTYGFIVEPELSAEDDMLLRGASTWIAVNKTTITDGGNF